MYLVLVVKGVINMETDLLSEIREEMKNPKPKKVEEKAKKSYTSLKLKLVALLLMLLLVCTELVVLLWSGWMWSQLNEMRLQSPLIAQSPLVWWEKQNTTTNEVQPLEVISERTKKQIIYDAGLGEIVYKVHTLETTNGQAERGHHKYCENLGKTNEFGFFKNGNRQYCYSKFEESVEDVTAWFRSNLSEMPLPIALCYYNTGTMRSDCEYLKNYNSL